MTADDTFTPPAPHATADGTYVIVVLGVAGSVESITGVDGGKPQYLQTYDPEAKFGRGDVLTTTDPAEAARFPAAAAAMECWRTVPRARRYRGDGKPNRPFTALTISIEPRQ